MEMSPNQVRTASFATSRKGWDPSEVTAFLERCADALESAQNHATAMEARARAAVSKLQELSNAAPSAPAEPERPPVDDQAETISRTLLLAQRAADEAIADARAEAERIVADARVEARRAESDERDLVRSEVDALMARRGFLQSDVEQLENFLLDQRERLRGAASQLVDMAERVPNGLGYLRPPLLSASDDDTPVGDEHARDEFAGLEAVDVTDDATDDATGDATGDVTVDATGDATGDATDAVSGDVTEAAGDAPDERGDEPGDGPLDELRIDPLDVDDHAGERFGSDVDDETEAMPTVRIGGGSGAVPGSGAGSVGTSDDDPTPEGLPLRFARDDVGGDDDSGGADRSGRRGR